MDAQPLRHCGNELSWCQLAHILNDGIRESLDYSETLEFHQTQ